MTTDIGGTAVILAEGVLGTPLGKTAHGLIRESRRFDIAGVIDSQHSGDDAGRVVDGIVRGIPVFSSLHEALTGVHRGVDWCIVGGASWGGRLTSDMRRTLVDAVESGLSVVNGLQEFALDDPLIARAARRSGVTVIDVRRTPPRDELHVWTGAVRGITAPRIAVLGTDGAIGKRTTATWLTDGCRGSGIRAELIYTGQTGWMQGVANFGITLDSLVNDFVSGELEYALLQCSRETRPDVLIIEGQSSLRHPAGPGGSAILLSAGVSAVVLQHQPSRKHFYGFESLGDIIPSVVDEVELIARYGVKTLAVALNMTDIPSSLHSKTVASIRSEVGLPVVRPLEDGVDDLVHLVRDHIASH